MPTQTHIDRGTCNIGKNRPHLCYACDFTTKSLPCRLSPMRCYGIWHQHRRFGPARTRFQLNLVKDNSNSLSLTTCDHISLLQNRKLSPLGIRHSWDLGVLPWGLYQNCAVRTGTVHNFSFKIERARTRTAETTTAGCLQSVSHVIQRWTWVGHTHGLGLVGFNATVMGWIHRLHETTCKTYAFYTKKIKLI